MRGTSLAIVTGSWIIIMLTNFSIISALAGASSLSITTDKTRYTRDEMIKLVVSNNLDIPIWYIGYPQSELTFWTIERAKDKGWRRMDFRLPMIKEGRETCIIAMYERPIGSVKELKPESDLHFEWNQKICLLKIVTESSEPETIERGTYRFVLHYSLNTIKSEKGEAEPWKRPIELDEIKVVYSNEFILE